MGLEQQQENRIREARPPVTSEQTDSLESERLPPLPSSHEVVSRGGDQKALETLRTIAARDIEDATPEIIGFLIQEGYLSSLTSDEFCTQSGQGQMLPDLRITSEGATSDLARLKIEEARLEFWSHSPIATAFFWLTLRPGAQAEYGEALGSKTEEREQAEQFSTSLSERIEKLEQLTSHLNLHLNFKDQHLALTEAGKNLLNEADTFPGSHKDSSLETISAARERWNRLVEKWQDAYQIRDVSGTAAARLAAVSEDFDVPLEDLLHRFQRAYQVHGIGSGPASYFSSQSAVTGIPIESYIEGFVSAYREPRLDMAAATHLTDFSLNNHIDLNSLIDDWRRFYAVQGVNSLSAAQLATASQTEDVHGVDLVNAWAQGWRVEGLCSQAATAFAVAAYNQGADLSGLIDCWSDFWEIRGCNSLASAYLASAVVCNGLDQSELESAFNHAYSIRGIGAVPAAHMARLAVETQIPIQDLVRRFGEAYALRAIRGDAASALVCAFHGLHLVNDERAGGPTSSSDSSSGFNLGGAIIGDLIDDNSFNLSGGFLLGGMW